jgi:lipoate-protein ligase A
MAADEVLLESAVRGVASLRFYVWSPATVSLGYFQPEEVRRSDPRLVSLPFVRRPSGGMTLVHDHELTYALALPAGPPWQVGGESPWLCRMHKIIGEALRRWDVQAAAASCAQTAHAASPLCFQHTTPGDLLLGEAKVVGSAQRRQRGALLQHGAIVLSASTAAPAIAGVKELAGRVVGMQELSDAITKAFIRDTSWEFVESAWDSAEQERLEILVATKYSQDNWNRKR